MEEGEISTWFGTTGGLRGGFGFFTTLCNRCCCCMCSNCFNCMAKLIPAAPLPDSALFFLPSSVVWRLSEPVGMDGMWERICGNGPAEALLLVAPNPGNSLGVGACDCVCIKECDGTVFNLVRKILNAELCWKIKNQVFQLSTHLLSMLTTEHQSCGQLR
jgi:hypothetical protein